VDRQPIHVRIRLGAPAAKHHPCRHRKCRDKDYEHHNRSDDGLKSGVPTFHITSNDEVERRGGAPTPNEGSLSRSSIPSAHRRRAPRSLELLDSGVPTPVFEQRESSHRRRARTRLSRKLAMPAAESLANHRFSSTRAQLHQR